MKFCVEHNGQVEQRLLRYIADEYTFDVYPSVKEISFDTVLNKLNLTAVANNTIAQIWGFCPYGEWVKGNYNVPKSVEGALKVVDNLEPGFSYRINKNGDWTTYVNTQTGWICIGNPEKKGNAVEFINNCIAVIDDDKEFVSLWLKPEVLPHI
jgi:hypothetical protein